jgi:hypothetical protein
VPSNRLDSSSIYCDTRKHLKAGTQMGNPEGYGDSATGRLHLSCLSQILVLKGGSHRIHLSRRNS